MRRNRVLTQARLRELLHYDQETGVFIWVKPTSDRMKPSDCAGTSRPDGYVLISIDYASYLAHRLAWLWTTGGLPSGEIDHINGDPSDNRIVNLRLATRSGQLANARLRNDNTSGFKGVTLDRRTGRWRAGINKNGKTNHLGVRDTPEEAAVLYAEAAAKVFGEFARVA